MYAHKNIIFFQNKSSNKDLTSTERQQILQALLELYEDVKLEKGDVIAIVDSSNLHSNTVGRL